MKWRIDNFREKVKPRLAKGTIYYHTRNIIKTKNLDPYLLNIVTRKKYDMLQRHILAYELRQKGFTFQEIADCMRRKDHTTMMSGIGLIRDLLYTKDEILKPYYPEKFKR